MKISRIAVLCFAAALMGSECSAQGLPAFGYQSPAGLTQTELPAVKGQLLPLAQTGGNDDLITFSILSSLPQTDPQTAAWLAGRIPGLNKAALKTVPESSIESIMQRASAAHATYLDIFTDPGLGKSNPDLYFLSQDVLDQLNRKWDSGTLPVNGAAKDGQRFFMQGLVAGNGAVYILYNLTQFDFKQDGQDFRVVDGGRVSVTALGPGDVGIAGVKAHGCKGPFCAWVDIERITKTGPTSARLKHSRGEANTSLSPVHHR
jgi:hypothetical protein